MSLKNARKLVTYVSIVIAVVGLTEWFYARFLSHTPAALWDKIAIAYGLVFCLFLVFDAIGRNAARLRKQADEQGGRPRPVVSPTPGQQVSAAAPQMTSGQVHLERIRPNQALLLQEMVDSAVSETLALEELRPSLDADGHVSDLSVRELIENPLYFTFFIVYHDKVIGCCAFKSVHPAYEIVLFYVDGAYRRRHGGEVGMHKLREFAQLRGSNEAFVVEVSTANMRAQRFFEACGLHVDKQADTGLGRVLLTAHVVTAHVGETLR